MTSRLWIGLAILVALTPVGWLAKGTAWGEWSATELAGRTGFVPEGLRRLSQAWHAMLTGYALPGWSQGWREIAGYALSALLGVALVIVIIIVVGRVLTGRRKP